MAGLFFGNKSKRLAYFPDKEGIFFASHINKWVVRIKIKNNYSTLAQFKTKEEAEKYYKKTKS